MVKHKHFKVKGFWNFSYQAEVHVVPKTWEKWISIVRKKHGKIQTFQIYGFLKYFWCSRNPYNSQIMGKVNSLNTGKVWKKTNIRKLWISHIFWVKQKSIPFPKHGKSEFTWYGKSIRRHRDFPYSSLPRRFRVDENPCNS